MSEISSTLLYQCLDKMDVRDTSDLLTFFKMNGNTKQYKCIKVLLDLLNPKKKIDRVGFYRNVIGEADSFDDKKLRHLMSSSLLLFHDFIVTRQLKKSPLTKDLLLLEGLKQMGMDKEHDRILTKKVVKLEGMNLRNSDFYYYQYRLQKLLIDSNLKDQRVRQLNIGSVKIALDNYYKTELSFSDLLMANYKVHNPTYSQEINETYTPESALFYEALIKLILNQNEEEYYTLKTKLYDLSIFNNAEYRDILLHTINFCIKRINDQKFEFINECYELYMWGLQTGILLEKGYISRFTFKNIITIWLKGEDKTKASEALNNLSKYLNPTEKNATLLYNTARIHYFSKDYEITMEILRNLNYHDLLDELDGRRMLMKIYFENKEWFVLDSFLDSFSAFLRRNKNIGYHKDYYLNLVKYVKRLMNLETMKKETKEKLLKQIGKEKKLNDRKWLEGLLTL